METLSASMILGLRVLSMLHCDKAQGIQGLSQTRGLMSRIGFGIPGLRSVPIWSNIMRLYLIISYPLPAVFPFLLRDKFV